MTIWTTILGLFHKQVRELTPLPPVGKLIPVTPERVLKKKSYRSIVNAGKGLWIAYGYIGSVREVLYRGYHYHEAIAAKNLWDTAGIIDKSKTDKVAKTAKKRPKVFPPGIRKHKNSWIARSSSGQHLYSGRSYHEAVQARLKFDKTGERSLKRKEK